MGRLFLTLIDAMSTTSCRQCQCAVRRDNVGEICHWSRISKTARDRKGCNHYLPNLTIWTAS